MATKTSTLRAADPGLDHDTRDLYEAVTDLVRVYQFRDRNMICCHDISVTQCYALDALVRAGTMALGSLATTLMLDKSTTSRVVDALERKGYVKRTVHPDDARVVRLTATIRGRNLHETIRREMLDEERAIIADLPADVRRATVDVVRKLARLAAERRGCCGPEACDC